jgi:hypothetical protein
MVMAYSLASVELRFSDVFGEEKPDLKIVLHDSDIGLKKFDRHQETKAVKRMNPKNENR